MCGGDPGSYRGGATSQMTIISRLWSGLYSLPKAFWGFYCVGFFVVYFAMAAFMLALMPSINLTAYIIGLCVFWAYMFIASVGVWRSAAISLRSPIWMARFWAVAARDIVTIVAMGFVWQLVNRLGLVSL